MFIFYSNCSIFFKFIGVDKELAISAEVYLTDFGILMMLFVITEVTKAFLYIFDIFIPQVIA